MGVGEGEPDFGDLAGTEEGVDELDAGAEEGDIAHGFLRGFLGAFPQARALDVDPDKVHLGMSPGQCNRVIALAAAQFHDDGLILGEHVGIPSALDGMVPKDQFPGAFRLGQHGSRVRLQQAAERLVLGEFLEFTVSHQSLFLDTTRPMPRSPSGGLPTRTDNVHIPHSSGWTPARYGARICREKSVPFPASGR